MDRDFNKNFQQRKFVKAARSSAGRNLNNKKLQISLKNESMIIKRKNNDERQNEHKRSRNDNFTKILVDTTRTCLTSNSSKNLANERLKKLKRSLSEKRNDSGHYTSAVGDRANIATGRKSDINLRTNSTVSRRTICQSSWKSAQDRLAVKRSANLSVSAASSTSTRHCTVKKLNHSFPSCSRPVTREDRILSIDATGRTRTVVSSADTPVKHENRLSLSHSVSTPFDDGISNSKRTSDSAATCSQGESSLNYSEDMDWSPVNEHTVIENISVVRKQLDYLGHRVDVPPVGDANRPASRGLYIIVDTNIFLSHLHYLSELKNKTLTETGPTVIMVPWMVLQELDFIKDGHSHKSLQASARKAVNFINTCLLNKDPHLKGQSVTDASNQDIQSNNPDDGILFCCLQLLGQGKEVVLLSNDKNLRNKAIISEVQAYNRDELVLRLSEGVRSVERLQLALGDCLSRIVEQEMEAAYGHELWQRMARLVPPLTLDEGLQCLRRYWMPVFSFKLLKHCKPCIDDFNAFLLATLHSRDSLTTQQFTKFVEFCLRLCIYLKNAFDQHRPHVTDTINFIQSCASRVGT